MKRLEGKVAIITGASSGFGRDIARTFAREGAKVICSDIKQDGVEIDGLADPTDKVIRDAGGEAIFVKCDVSKEDEVKALVAAAVKQFGRLDIMVNNAGIMRAGRLMHDFDECDLDAVYNVNIKGAWNGCKHAILQFLSQGDGGKIVNLSSSIVIAPAPGQMPYNISKAAVANMTKSIAVEYGRNKINANAICPTICITPMAAPLYAIEKIRKDTEDKIPLGRWGKTKDVADVALFLASDEADFLTGVLVPVDGGETVSSHYPREIGL